MSDTGSYLTKKKDAKKYTRKVPYPVIPFILLLLYLSIMISLSSNFS